MNDKNYFLNLSVSLKELSKESSETIVNERNHTTNDQNNKEVTIGQDENIIASISTTNDDGTSIAIDKSPSSELDNISDEIINSSRYDQPNDRDLPTDDLARLVVMSPCAEEKIADEISIESITICNSTDDMSDNSKIQRDHIEPLPDAAHPQDENENEDQLELVSLESPVVTVDTQDANEKGEKWGVINVMPELKWFVTIDLNRKLQSINFSEIPKIYVQLMKKLEEIKPKCPDKSIYENFQIQLRPIRRNSSLYELFLRVDVSKWYNLEKKTDKNIKEKFDYYINRVKEGYENDGFYSNLRPNNNCKNLEDLYQCEELSEVNGEWKKCGFYVKKQYCIYQIDKVYAAARSNGLPVITVSPHDHCHNKDWVEKIRVFQQQLIDTITSAAWDAVLKVLIYIQETLDLSELPFYEIYVNFGEWHSQGPKGHGHINIILTREAIDACGKVGGILHCLANSTISPPDYRRNDAEKLMEKLNAEKN